MKDVRVLDCTLRDGGYVNDWNFGIGSIKSIISRLAKANLDIIEVGFIDDRNKYNLDRSLFPNSDAIKPALKNIDTRSSMIVLPLDHRGRGRRGGGRGSAFRYRHGHFGVH